MRDASGFNGRPDTEQHIEKYGHYPTGLGDPAFYKYCISLSLLKDGMLIYMGC